MEEERREMRKIDRVLLSVAALGLCSCSLDRAAGVAGDSADSVAVSEPASGLVIGTFDSRCVALAYYRSEAVLGRLDGMYAEYEEAVASGDSIRAEELDSTGRALQQLMHEQVFSTGDVDEIMWEVWADLPAIAEEAGVDLIVSEWDLLYDCGTLVKLDLTDTLVRRFNPSEETLEIISQMKGMPAVPSQFLSPDA
jgi:hypothetical protein